jgi:hypothetical protein
VKKLGTLTGFSTKENAVDLGAQAGAFGAGCFDS